MAADRKDSKNKKKPESKKAENKSKAKKAQKMEISPVRATIEILKADPPSKQ